MAQVGALERRAWGSLATDRLHTQTRDPPPQVLARAGREWCPGRDLNSHGFPHTPLKRTCLPIPPPGQSRSSLEAQRLLPPVAGALAGAFAGVVAGAGVAGGSALGVSPPPAGAPGVGAGTAGAL